MTLLLLAAQNNFTNTALCLIREGRQVSNQVDRKGNTPLHYAVKQKNLTVVKALLNAGYDVNARKQYSGLTPLHIAVTVFDNFEDFLEVFKAFLAKNCNLNYQCFGTLETPLYRAIVLGKTEIAELLLISGADPNLSNPFGVSCLQKAVQKNNTRLTEVLLHCGVNKKKEISIMKRQSSLIRQMDNLIDLTDLFTETQPKTLQACCRDVIRRCFTVNLYTALQKLNLPKYIKDYMLFCDVSEYYKFLTNINIRPS
ncbi:poly [ADP-ribose] polymerase tankyrase-1-like [Saccostrea echinata]|uniref:poly [ADP-ribose] polymerase tankyrase-1-like n=1 Tax=Saccostrea echinata TaxID=191078 RepID=UPI002A80AEC9|nr:poly [ADP-ribose] polymerase tankyrase-1-like [Saccostrea echinata]